MVWASLSDRFYLQIVMSVGVEGEISSFVARKPSFFKLPGVALNLGSVRLL